ncbi:hypothetical protein Y032_0040g336 [Ancylostoma ceylanicum]|uniref:G-protein coupled receptors family 1 profile domain-containing protein n=1 Tax=Ancylostoma ceylanicum TaxID=53326 RepID=A0A016UJE4_9BILA|nr:hypothetical protein Y032_0040g336 [Ancylostoma ceylanicum]
MIDCVDVNHILRMYGDWTSLVEVRVIYSLVYALIFIVGVVGNGLLISSVLLRKRSTVANVFLVNLAVSDLLLCITAVPITPVLAFMKRWMFGLVLCKIVPSCQAISVLISSWCLCYIAIDRYRSIVTPLKEPWKLKHAQWILMCTWLVAMFASSPLYFSQSLKTLSMANITLCGEFCGEFNWDQEDHTKLVYGFSLLVVQFVIPAIIMSFCYWKILQKHVVLADDAKTVFSTEIRGSLVLDIWEKGEKCESKVRATDPM